MRKLLLSFLLLSGAAVTKAQTSAKVFTTLEPYFGASAYQVGLGSAGTPRIFLDDININKTLIPGADSLVITSIKHVVYGAPNRPASTIRFYVAELDTADATGLGKIFQWGQVSVGASATSITTYAGGGDSVRRVTAVKLLNDPADNYETIFGGFSVSAVNSFYWLPAVDSFNSVDRFWVYDADATDKKSMLWFGGSPMATLTTEVYGYGIKKNNESLPISWLAIDAKNNGNATNTISWSTSAEHNNKGYYVERSADGTNFEVLGFVAAAGNDRIQQNDYSFVDATPLAGTNTYRVRQVDVDGKENISKIVSVQTFAGNIAVYPNPSNDVFNVALQLNTTSKVNVQLLAADGKILESIEKGTLTAGAHQVRFAPKAAGIYRVKVTIDGVSTIKTVSKL